MNSKSKLLLLYTEPGAKYLSSALLDFPLNSAGTRGIKPAILLKTAEVNTQNLQTAWDLFNLAALLVPQTTGVELQMKCVNIPESDDSVVSAPLPTTHRSQLPNIKIAKSLCVGVASRDPSLPFLTVIVSSVFSSRHRTNRFKTR